MTLDQLERLMDTVSRMRDKFRSDYDTIDVFLDGKVDELIELAKASRDIPLSRLNDTPATERFIKARAKVFDNE